MGCQKAFLESYKLFSIKLNFFAKYAKCHKTIPAHKPVQIWGKSLTFTKIFLKMNFNLSEEQLMIQQAARDFAQNELLPGVIERDRDQKFPQEQVRKMAELGFLGMMVDPKYGGAGLDAISYVVAMEEIAKVDASAAVIMSVNNSLVCAGLEKYASEDQK